MGGGPRDLGIAFFEYSLQVPANRIGSGHFDLGQLKVIQEVISRVVFMCFATFCMRPPERKSALAEANAPYSSSRAARLQTHFFVTRTCQLLP